MMLWLILSVLAADGGLEPEPTPAPASKWSWSHADGGWLDDAGVTDVLTTRVGETAELRLDLPIVLMQCDAPLLTLGATLDSLLLTAVKPGRTTCGFWYGTRSWPHRTLDVTVFK